ncbi:Sensory histidine kinase QseC [Snodgrassella communis]|uniref:ATP-binding protein n=1 Tax=Snodgrassella communis TaxID=2946699 RepID=UPI0004611989|nr:ATP-binding protein [Snodgrassella communis]KDN11607.1 Sensory histidine kinase QseC [Snodgrassella communis]
MKPTTAISRRLLIYLGITLPVLWIVTAFISAAAVMHEINEASDTQMSQLAQRLMHIPINLNSNYNPTLPPIPKSQRGLIDSKESGYAIWYKGQLINADQTGQTIAYKSNYQGFVNQGYWWQSHAWRIFYLHDPQLQLQVAVSFSMHERLQTVLRAVWAQLGVSILALPLLLWLIAWGVRRGTKPLQHLAQTLYQRDPHSVSPISGTVPTEIQPIITALNDLLQRIEQTRARELRFTADAAHELRSPLAALKVQTEVLALTNLDDTQQQRVRNIEHSINRTTHLVDQLLTLSRLDPLTTPPYTAKVNWTDITSEAIESVNLYARECHSRIQRQFQTEPLAVLPLYGDPTLLTILIRNLLDNAIRYSPEHSTINITLTADTITITNSGNGVAPESLQRLHERFFRPAGQEKSGSGLGLSIVDSIAQLHGLEVELSNIENEHQKRVGFKVILKIQYSKI